MKISFLFFIVLFTLSLSSGHSQAPVGDTAGNIVRSGTGYYIVPALSGRGGGVNLSPTTFNQKCPLDVTQENNEQRNGLPLTFIPAYPTRNRIIYEYRDLNIEFLNATTCGQPAVWRVGEVNGLRVVSSRGTVGNPGCRTLYNWFKIERYENNYKIVFCPSVCYSCTPDCGDVGTTIAKTRRRSLVVDDDPLMVEFIKACQ